MDLNEQIEWPCIHMSCDLLLRFIIIKEAFIFLISTGSKVTKLLIKSHFKLLIGLTAVRPHLLKPIHYEKTDRFWIIGKRTRLAILITYFHYLYMDILKLLIQTLEWLRVGIGRKLSLVKDRTLLFYFIHFVYCFLLQIWNSNSIKLQEF